jgi:hypothetical protein
MDAIPGRGGRSRCLFVTDRRRRRVRAQRVSSNDLGDDHLGREITNLPASMFRSVLWQLSSPGAFAGTWITIHLPTLPMIRGTPRRALREAASRTRKSICSQQDNSLECSETHHGSWTHGSTMLAARARRMLPVATASVRLFLDALHPAWRERLAETRPAALQRNRPIHFGEYFSSAGA